MSTPQDWIPAHAQKPEKGVYVRARVNHYAVREELTVMWADGEPFDFSYDQKTETIIRGESTVETKRIEDIVPMERGWYVVVEPGRGGVHEPIEFVTHWKPMDECPAVTRAWIHDEWLSWCEQMGVDPKKPHRASKWWPGKHDVAVDEPQLEEAP